MRQVGAHRLAQGEEAPTAIPVAEGLGQAFVNGAALATAHMHASHMVGLLQLWIIDRDFHAAGGTGPAAAAWNGIGQSHDASMPLATEPGKQLRKWRCRRTYRRLPVRSACLPEWCGSPRWCSCNAWW